MYNLCFSCKIKRNRDYGTTKNLSRTVEFHDPLLMSLVSVDGERNRSLVLYSLVVYDGDVKLRWKTFEYLKVEVAKNRW